MKRRAALPALACALFAKSAAAEPDMFVETFRALEKATFELHFWSSIDLGTETAITTKGRPRSSSVRLAFSAVGFGGSLALGRGYRDDDRGFVARAAFEARPLGMFRERLYENVDPWVRGGLEGGALGGFAGSAFVGAGVVVAPWLHPREGFGPGAFVSYDHAVLASRGMGGGVISGGAVFRGAF